MKYIIFVLVISLFIIGCSEEKIIGGDKDEHGCLIGAGYTWCESKEKCLRTWEEECSDDETLECENDSDCVKGGCSGTVCQSKDTPPVFTTCEYMLEYDCYKDISCGCSDGKCEWDKTEDFDDCVLKARESGIEVVG